MRGDRGRGDGGYIAAIMALAMVVLFVFAAFAVDVGGWYARASDLQRAADASALAGVVWMPDFNTARTVAEQTATRNGYTTGGAITVTASPVAGDSRRLRVTITDNNVDQYFSQLVRDNQTLTRTAVAEYVLPVPLGARGNRIGNNGSTFDQNLWASISGPYTNRVDGDPYSTKCPNGSSGTGCPQTNTEYRTTGYIYAIEVTPAMVGQTVNVDVYDAGHYQRANYANVETADNGAVNTQFELFDSDNTALDVSDNLVPAKSRAGRCSTGPGRFRILTEANPEIYKNQWVRLCSFAPTLAGQHFIQVKSSNIPTVSDAGVGWNQYSIRTTASTNPRLFAINDLSLFNNLPGQSGTFNATFDLAEVATIHRGKTMQIDLYDPGDGQSGDYFVNILVPGMATVPCEYGVRNTTLTSIANCRIQTRNVSASPTNQYNGQWLRIEVGIPTGYTCTPNCWWRIKYDFENVAAGNSPNDRTVWAAKVVGDPVHLVTET